MRTKSRVLIHPNLSSRIYELLKEDILRGKVSSGDHLSESQLALELGVSRIPVREAISRLAQEGIVEVLPRRGAFVADLSEEQIIELYDVREVLEGLAARLAAERVTGEVIEQMKNYFKSQEVPSKKKNFKDYSIAVFSFHKLLVQTSRNERLVSIMNGLFDQIRLLQLKSVTLSGPGDRPLREHRAIIESLERHDPDLAEKLTRGHIRNVKSDVLLFLQEQREGRPR